MSKNLPVPLPEDSGEFLLFQSQDGQTRIDVRMAHETVWLSQRDMAELFQTTPQNVTQHIATVYDESELSEAATCKEFLQVRSEGGRQVQRFLQHYNLDVIISVGYRVKSQRGTQFRIWATQRLREYLVKGFAMDDRRLKHAGGDFDSEVPKGRLYVSPGQRPCRYPQKCPERRLIIAPAFMPGKSLVEQLCYANDERFTSHCDPFVRDLRERK